MKELKALLKKTILVNYGIKGKKVDRLVKHMARQMLFKEVDNYLDVNYINEMLYAEDKDGNEVEIDSKKARTRPNLDYSEKTLRDEIIEENKILDRC